MKHTFRKKAAGLLAVLTLCSGLTGCSMFNQTTEIFDQASDIIDQAAEVVLGTEETTAAETTAAEAETTAASEKTTAKTTSGNTQETTSRTGNRTAGTGDHKQDVEAAKDVLEQFLGACQQGDADAIMDLSNIGNLLTLFGAEAGEIDEETIRQEMAESFGTITDFRIRGGQYDEELLAQFNDYLAEMQGSLDAVGGEEGLGLSLGDLGDLFGSIYRPIDGVCVFEVTATVDGEEETEELYVVRSGDKWTLDVAIIPAMTSFVDASEQLSANADAKSLYVAANCALTDMDAADFDIQQLTGELVFMQADFEGVHHIVNPQNAEELQKEFLYKLTLYFSDVTKLDCVSVYIDKGACTAAAVQKTDSSGFTQIGLYPEDEAFDDALLSIEDALAAAEENSN